jgi:hypothetical protein
MLTGLSSHEEYATRQSRSIPAKDWKFCTADDIVTDLKLNSDIDGLTILTEAKKHDSEPGNSNNRLCDNRYVQKGDKKPGRVILSKLI